MTVWEERDVADREQPQLEAALNELRDLDGEFEATYGQHVAGWQLRLGPVRLRGRFHSQTIARLYLGFCVACFAIGAALAVNSATKELGVAMVVGAIFAGGSFIVQWWALQMEKERELHSQLQGPNTAKYFKTLTRRRERLVAQIERLRPGYFDRAD